MAIQTAPKHGGDVLLRPVDAARIANVSLSTIRREIDRGELRARHVGRQLRIDPPTSACTSTGRTPMARTPKAPDPEPLFECVDGFASEWLDLHASDEFPNRFCRNGTLLRESHPVVKAHPWAFAPARAHTEPAA